MGADPGVTIRNRSRGYVIDVDPDSVDIHHFERLVGDGCNKIGAGLIESGYADLTEALTLWRGEPFAEFRHLLRFDEEDSRLTELRMAALETQAEAALRMGAPELVLTPLTQEAARNPSRERLVGHLMTALYMTGRQADAIQVFERTRAHLATELGVYPGDELSGIHLSILRQADVEPMPGGAASVSIPKQRGVFTDTEVPADAESEAGSGDSGFELFGRAEELAALAAATGDGLRGGGRLVAVVGEAGIGKTEVVLRFTAELEASGQEVVWARCWRPGAPAYWLWTQVLRELARLRPGVVRAARERYECLLDPSCWQDGHEGHADGSPQASFLFQEAMCEVVLAAADDRPVVIVLEDLQWADQPSLELLQFLTSRSHHHRLGIVVTVSPDRVGAARSRVVKAYELLADARTSTIRLGGLSRDAVAEWACAHTGTDVGRAIAGVLYERSAGNPYLLLQLFSLLPGNSSAMDALRTVRTAIPLGLRDAVARGLDRLPALVARVLRVCAVIGMEVDTALLDEVVDEPGVKDALESVTQSGWLHRDPDRPGRVRFPYEILRETLIDASSDADRTEIHARIATVLLAGDGLGCDRSEQIAYHVWQAEAFFDQDAPAHMLRAGQHAVRRLAYDEGEEWFRRGLRLLAHRPNSPARTDTAMALRRQLAVVLGAVRGWSDVEAIGLLRQCLAAAQDAQDAASLQWTWCYAQLVNGRYDECLPYLENLRRVAAAHGDPLAEAAHRFISGVIMHVRGRFVEALAALDAAIEHADSAPGGDWQQAPAYGLRVPIRVYRALTLRLIGDQTRAARQCDELLLLTERDATPYDRAIALYGCAMVAAVGGDAKTALCTSEEGLELAEQYHLRAGRDMLQVVRGWAEAQIYSGDDGIALMREAIADLSAMGTVIRNTLHLSLLAHCLRGAERADEEAAVRRRIRAEISLRGEYGYSDRFLPLSDATPDATSDAAPLPALTS